MAESEEPGKRERIEAEVAGNRLTLLPDGPDRLDALIALIDGARHSLRLLYYIFEDDQSGKRVRDALQAAIGRGVAVSLLVDGFGTDTGKAAFFQPLIDGDCNFCSFQPKLGRRYLLRNHQKLALADERVVIVGGFNVADDYFGTVEQGAWRDLGLQVEGPDVGCLTAYYDDLFRWAQKPGSRIRHLRRMLNQHSTVHGPLHWLFGGPTRRLSPWAKAVKQDMQHASQLDMIAAYFAPSRAILRRIGAIGRRGAARVVTAAKSDNSTTVGAARHTYWRLLRHDVEVYEYQPTKLHSKLIVIDDVVHIGSANFDMRSLYLNLEMMLRVDDPGFAAQMRGFMEHEIADSARITMADYVKRRTPINRLRWGFAYFLVAVMDYGVSRRLNFGLEG